MRNQFGFLFSLRADEIRAEFRRARPTEQWIEVFIDVLQVECGLNFESRSEMRDFLLEQPILDNLVDQMVGVLREEPPDVWGFPRHLVRHLEFWNLELDIRAQWIALAKESDQSFVDVSAANLYALFNGELPQSATASRISERRYPKFIDLNLAVQRYWIAMVRHSAKPWRFFPNRHPTEQRIRLSLAACLHLEHDGVEPKSSDYQFDSDYCIPGFEDLEPSVQQQWMDLVDDFYLIMLPLNLLQVGPYPYSLPVHLHKERLSLAAQSYYENKGVMPKRQTAWPLLEHPYRNQLPDLRRQCVVMARAQVPNGVEKEIWDLAEIIFYEYTGLIIIRKT